MSTEILALIIFVVILLQVAVLLGFLYRKRQYKELSTKNKNSQISTTPPSNLAWESFREFVVQRKVFENNNNSVCSFYLAPCDGKSLPTFKPGQFLTFKLTIGDLDANNVKPVIRCYSLSDSPQSNYYRISVKRIPRPINQPNVPPGVSSGFFHDYVKKGTKLLVKAPSGHFHLVEDEVLPIVLIGGGIGITPMLSIINAVLNKKNREVYLYYGLRNGDEHIMKKHLQMLAKTHDNFHLHVCYNAPNENDVEGVDYQHNSQVTIPLLRATLKLMRYQFYVCGPKPLMESIVPGLEKWGVDSGDIYYESFGAASLIKHEKKAPMATTQPITVTFSQSGKSIIWDFTADSLLEFAEANGVEIESGCRAGSCGSCMTVVKAGQVDYNQEPDADVIQGHCLLCISRPKTDLILEA